MSCAEKRSHITGEVLRQAIRHGRTVFGPFIKLASPQIVELAAYAGFDFVILDMEHGPISFESVENMVRAADGAGIASMVRVYENSPALIARSLDTGAQGVLVPHINDQRDAMALAKAARYFPQGERGVCRYVRAARYSEEDRDQYFARANEQSLVVAMIEGNEATTNLTEIMATPGLDVLFIGPYDLSQALGIPGQVMHPMVEREMARLVTQVRSAGLAVGTFVDDIEMARRWQEAGVQFIAISVDVGVICNAMRSMVLALHQVD